MTRTPDLPPPIWGNPAFTCPNCGAFAAQDARELITRSSVAMPVGTTTCSACPRIAIRRDDFDGTGFVLVWPVVGGPPPSPDLPERVMPLYSEAQSIANLSPRA